MTDGEAAAFVLRDVYFSYGKGGDTLQAISLNLPQGGRLVLLGANGGGKSTLLKLIAGRRKAREGEVEVLGKPAFETTALALQVTLVADEWDESICYLPVRKVLSGVCTDSNVLRMPRTARLLRALGIDANLLGSNLSAISSGQRRRVQLLCSLLPERALILLDEATNTLDVRARAALLDFLKEEECERRGATVVLCTHIFDGLDAWPTHVAHLERGRLLRSLPFASLQPGKSLYQMAVEWIAADDESVKAEAGASAALGELLGWVEEAEATVEEPSKRAKLVDSAKDGAESEADETYSTSTPVTVVPTETVPTEKATVGTANTSAAAMPSPSLLGPSAADALPRVSHPKLPHAAQLMVPPLQNAISAMQQRLAACSTALAESDAKTVEEETAQLSALWAGTMRALDAFTTAAAPATADSNDAAQPGGKTPLPFGWGSRFSTVSEDELAKRGAILKAEAQTPEVP